MPEEDDLEQPTEQPTEVALVQADGEEIEFAPDSAFAKEAVTKNRRKSVLRLGAIIGLFLWIAVSGLRRITNVMSHLLIPDPNQTFHCL